MAKQTNLTRTAGTFELRSKKTNGGKIHISSSVMDAY